jgi:uncharacterized protein (TIGR02996 family)
MTGDGDALLRAICESPWEDTPRLVYADWLDENGQPERAEFIRVQIEVAKLPSGERYGHPLARRSYELLMLGDPSKVSVRRREAKRPKKPWSATLPALEGVEWGSIYERGFQSLVTFADMHAALAHEDAVMAAAPIDAVIVKQLRPFMVEVLLTRPWMRRLSLLHLWGEVGTAGGEAIARSDALGRLERLDLSVARMTDAGLRAIAASSALPNLRHLQLEINTGGVTEVGLADLVASPALPRLIAVDGIDWALLWRTRGTDLQERFYERFPETYRRGE